MSETMTHILSRDDQPYLRFIGEELARVSVSTMWDEIELSLYKTSKGAFVFYSVITVFGSHGEPRHHAVLLDTEADVIEEVGLSGVGKELLRAAGIAGAVEDI